MSTEKTVEEEVLLQEAKELNVECPHGNWIGWCDGCDPQWSDYIKKTLQAERTKRDEMVFKERDFFEELRTYNPDYEDLHNHNLYWKIENASKIYKEFYNILKKYQTLNQQELKSRKIAKMEKELAELKD